MSMWGQIMLQYANSPIMENMIMFYDFSMIIIVLVVAMIMYLLFFMLYNKLTNRFLLEGQMIEIIWTVIPIIFFIFLAIPSLKLLYLSDEINNPIMSIKVLGHQWYWSYEFNDFKWINFDSFMIKDDENNLFRLLDVDKRLILPFNYQIRFLISSLDVIHSFTIPSLGSKVDAVPGRINQINLFMKRPGIYFGQCSEICGVNHSFMPIAIESTSLKNFINWINKI
uniref:Cytochrome c oxidase subunit 2 n=1 Tax=Philotrypesis sp. TL-2019 TaxID=2562751 RepID=A0A646QXE4_9HYME|nr:cytochrome c oxidase subunit II [Philotrypesis sp. TL-2019]